MRQARLKSELWIQAHIRRCQSAGAFCVVARRGDADAGAIAVRIYLARDEIRLLMQSMDFEGNAVWRDVFGGPVAQSRVDERLEKEARYDPDMWVIEIEGCDGAAYLEIAPEDPD